MTKRSPSGEVFKTPGILAAALTPFLAGTEKVDYDTLARELDWLVDNGSAAAVIGGVETQEYQVLEGEDREELIERSISTVDHRVATVVGVSHPSHGRSLALCEVAASSGADAVMVLVGLKPWGAPPTHDEVVRQVSAVAEVSGLPVVVYNNPRMGVDLSVEAMRELAGIEGVAAFKETSRDMGKLGRLLAEVDSEGQARVFTTMEALLFTLMMGGPGAMMPPPAVAIGSAIVDAYTSGDFAKACELQKIFATFPARWMRLGLTPVMKAAMGQTGIDVGAPLAPYESLGSGEVKALAALLADCGIPERSVNEVGRVVEATGEGT